VYQLRVVVLKHGTHPHPADPPPTLCPALATLRALSFALISVSPFWRCFRPIQSTTLCGASGHIPPRWWTRRGQPPGEGWVHLRAVVDGAGRWWSGRGCISAGRSGRMFLHV